MRGRTRWAWLVSCLLGLPFISLGPGPVSGPALAADGGPVVGSTVTTFRLRSDDAARAMVMQEDGAQLLVGAAGGDFGLVRLGRTGNKSDFGGDGLVMTDFNGRDDAANGVAIGPGGSVTAVGSSGGDVAVARYDHGGALDRSFGIEGRVVVDLGHSDDAAYAVTAEPDGSVTVAGGNGSAMVVLHLRPDGSLDPGFGTGGRLLVPLDGPSRALAVQPDGNLVIVGGGAGGIAVARITPAGGRDASFGDGGMVRLGGAAAAANAVGLLPDGRIVVVGGRAGDVALWRVLSSGQPDPTLGDGGSVVSDLGRSETAYGLLIEGDGRLRVVGEATDGSGFFATYLPSGQLDETFAAIFGAQGYRRTGPLRAVVPVAGGGWLAAGSSGGDFTRVSISTNGSDLPSRIDFGKPQEEARGAVRQPDGRIVVAGVTSAVIGLVRHLPDGSRDPSFGLGGRVVSDLAKLPSAVALQPGGRIVVVGQDGTDLVLVGFRPDGSVDTGFGTAGRAVTDLGSFGWGTAIAVLADGTLIVSGSTYDANFLARYQPDGQPDATFGTGGIAFGAFGSQRGLLHTLVVQPDGKLLATTYGPRIVRANADGTPDLSFGEGGAVALWGDDVHAGLAGAQAVVVQPDGHIVVGGSTPGGASVTFGILRLNPDGSLDGSWPPVSTVYFHPHGVYVKSARVVDLFLEADGRVLAVGDIAVARYRSDGRLDESFALEGRMLLGQVVEDPVRTFVSQGHVMSAGSTAGDAPGFVLATNRLLLPGQFQSTARAVAGDAAAAVSWDPVGDAANPPLSYTVTASDGIHQVTVTEPSTRQVVFNGLTNGTAYTFTVRGTFANGTGPPSAPTPAVVPMGRLRVWGFGGLGELGTGSTANISAPAALPGLVNWRAVAGGLAHSLAVAPDRRVWSWGWNAYGQLGDGTTVQRNGPVRVPGLTDVTAVAAGYVHSLALRADGTVWAWGLNHVGQLGDGTTVDRRTPVRVPGLRGVKAVAVGAYHSLAVTADGKVWAWGWNAFGQLGMDSTSDRHVPTPVHGPGDVVSVAAGAYHSLLRTSTGQVWAWGWNALGQLGDGTITDRWEPVVVEQFSSGSATSIAAGAYHSVASNSGVGEAFGWGWNGFGQLGDGSTAVRLKPVVASGLEGVASVSAGLYHTVAVGTDGSVSAWGWNAYGQVGDGSVSDRRRPVKVLPPLSAASASAGGLHTLIA